MRREKAGFFGFRRQVGVETEYDVGIGVAALEPQPVEKRDPVGDGNEFQVAVALRLESLLDLRTRPQSAVKLS